MAGREHTRILPKGLPLLLGRSDDAALLRAAHRLASSSHLILLTDDADALDGGGLPGNVAIVEPEELIEGGVAPIERAWDEGVRSWLTRMFPGDVGGCSLAEALWVNAFQRPRLQSRIDEVRLAMEVFGRLEPTALHLVGELPFFCANLPNEARRRRIPVLEEGRRRLRRGLQRTLKWPVGLAMAAAMTSRAAVRILRLVGSRRAAERRIREVAPESPAPEIWVALSPKWVPPARAVLRSILPELERRQIRWGLLYEVNFGEPKDEQGGVDEISWLDGSHASLRPAAVDQATGSASWGEAVRTIATFVPLALLSSVRVLRFGSSLKIAGMAAAGDEDLEELLRVSTVDLARVVDARLAAGRWLARWPETRAVVFSTAAAGEAKVVDLAAQREGITTIDFVHGYATYGNLRTAWRSRSSISVSWTDEQAARYREMGSNQDSWGGYFPYQALPKRPSRARPRILVLLSYVQGYSPFPANRKYARRMGRAIRAMLSQVGDRADVRIRLHPMDRPEAWDEILGGDSRLQFSDEEHLAADLAGADLVVTSISSAYLEALLYDVPIYLDGRGFVVERNTIFAHVPSARWFSDGDELCRMVERFIDGLDDAGPEQALRQRCFGGSGTPRMPGDIVDALHATMNEPREHQNNTR